MIGSSALKHLCLADLTYTDVGATRGPLPKGYHHLDRRRVVGRGGDDFHAAADVLMRWGLHRRAGLTVTAQAEVAAQNVNLILGVGIGRFRLPAPCRVIYTCTETDQRGFAYGTLPGHPESGEERFTVQRLADDRVILRIVAFSKPAMWWSRLGGPLNRGVQEFVTRRYLHSLDD